jgi:hypothetical protein
MTWEQIDSPLQNLSISTKGGNNKEVLQTVSNAECDGEVMAVINVKCNCAQGKGYSNHKRSAHGKWVWDATSHTCVLSLSNARKQTREDVHDNGDYNGGRSDEI